ncbi:RNA methyltransferase [Croceitalea sp. MTPC5]|uniref:TrmH family RNA methyltransferase n=1 Tax=Croceitalea sp. MTPC5 TaxID=3056565 RepID=UPI002B3BF708|nr:RNA methyltransferase [Croceitalea sp. MTPC5]
MVSKNQLKLIKNLHQKKYRNQYQLFFVEGIKTVNELLKSDFEVDGLYVVGDSAAQFSSLATSIISEKDLKKISALRSPSGVLGVFKMPKPKKVLAQDWIVALDEVRDPGNLGTVIRLCDWFGIEHLICSKGTVDCYNPKVLQATMGSIARVNIVYEDLGALIEGTELPVFGAFMDGANVHHEKLPEAGILIMGNEANGISDAVAQNIQKKIGIPQFGDPLAESLNIATATAILLNEIRKG